MATWRQREIRAALYAGEPIPELRSMDSYSTLPIAYVQCYSPNGTPTIRVYCYNAASILHAVEHANRADSVHVRVWTEKD